MNSILSIIELAKQAGHQIKPGWHLKIYNGAYMPLCIEHIGTGPRGLPALSVAHYGEQYGDLMADPEMCFEITPATALAPIRLEPFSWRNDYMGLDQENAWRTDDGKIRVNFGAREGHLEFAKMWDKNISEQGFVLAAETQLKTSEKS